MRRAESIGGDPLERFREYVPLGFVYRLDLMCERVPRYYDGTLERCWGDIDIGWEEYLGGTGELLKKNQKSTGNNCGSARSIL